MHDIAVIGRGLMGAAAARHLAKAGHDVALIGPGEPADKRAHRGVFASHYDEGRITRRAATDPFWAEASAASIARYPEIEAEGGISFFTEVGGVMAGPAEGAMMRAVMRTESACGTGAAALTGAALAVSLPDFALPEGFAALYERKGAGHISPRRLVAAQAEAARRHGATLIDAAASGLDETGAAVSIATANGPVQARRALVAAGAMTDHLLARPPQLKVYARTVALFRVSGAEARRLSALPTLIADPGDAQEVYLLPPIRYPDGAWYLKIGGDPVDRALTTPRDIGDWFRSGGDADVRDNLAAIMRRLMPGLAIEAVTMDACVTTWTNDYRPEIGVISPRIAVATGGNGAGAKCSDELGRRGAEAVRAL